MGTPTPPCQPERVGRSLQRSCWSRTGWGRGARGRQFQGESKRQARGCLSVLSLLAVPPALLPWESRPPAQVSPAPWIGKRVSWVGAMWICPSACFRGWSIRRRRLPPRLLGPRAVVRTLNREEETATRVLLQGCRHSLCQLSDSVRSGIRAGPEGPSAEKELQQACIGTDPQCTLFLTRSYFAVYLSLTWCLAFSESPPSPYCPLLGSGVEGEIWLSAKPCSTDFVSF